MQSLVTELEVFLLELVPDLHKFWQGISTERIDELEKVAGRPLPAFYRWFLSKMGHSMGPIGYLTNDFSSAAVLSYHRDEPLTDDLPWLSIGGATVDDQMAIDYFYDLKNSPEDDAPVLAQDFQGAHAYFHESFREMLAWSVMYRFRVNRAPQQCGGIVRDENEDVKAVLGPTMKACGYDEPISTGTHCGIYCRADSALVCRVSPGDDAVPYLFFQFGGENATILRKALGEITVRSDLEVEVTEWTPALDN
jgi:hypothetical protein